MKRTLVLPYKSGDRSAGLDPEADCVEIYRALCTLEFPWDINQALSFALFRTYAVPSIGRLLDQTGQFTSACQQRYDDTSLLIEAPMVHGFASPEGRAAVRRINQMHGMYDISNDDMLYVLATLVVVPKRWLNDFGWRPLTDGEVKASVHYYRGLGQRLAIKGVPDTYEQFADLMDAYEREHFDYDEGGRRVADSTLALVVSFYPRIAARGVRIFNRALMDDSLLKAYAYDVPSPLARRVSTGALRVRARFLSVLPPRRRPRRLIDTRQVRGYTGSPDLTAMGTFAPGCPVGPGLAHPNKKAGTAV